MSFISGLTEGHELPGISANCGARFRITRFLAAIALLAIVLSPDVGFALNPERALTQALLRKWQSGQGLPQPTVLVIRQTSDAVLWLGTPSGLYRFDGIHFDPAKITSGVKLDRLWIQDLCEDAEHQLWIATDGAGLIRLKEGAAIACGADEGCPLINARALCTDRSGGLWAGGDEGLVRFSEGRFQVYGADDGFTAKSVRAMAQSPEGSLWIGGDGAELTVYKDGKFSRRRLPGAGTVNAILADDAQGVWVGTESGLLHVEGEQVRRLTRADGLADDAVETLMKSRDGTVWIGSRDGFSRLRGAEIESFRTHDGLTQSTVLALCEDHEGSIWVGTKHGLNQFLDRRTLPLTTSEGLPSNDTGPVLQDRAGQIWIGTLNRGLARYDGRRCELAFSTKNGLPSNKVLSLCAGAEDDLWVGTERGLCSIRGDNVAEVYTTEAGLPSNRVSSIAQDSASRLWVGTDAGLVRFEDGRFVAPEGETALVGAPIRSLIDAGDQGIIVAYQDGGLFRVTDNVAATLSHEIGQLRNVDAFHRDSDGILWIGTGGGGLIRIHGERLARLGVRDGLYDDEISGITSDDDGRLWIACSRGIYFLNRHELAEFAAGRLTRVKSAPFSPTDALRTVECQKGVQPGVWKTNDGSIWFSTIHGALVLDGDHIRRELPPPSVVIEEVQINGQDVRPERRLTATPGRTNLHVKYAALSYAAPTRIAFQYRLTGFESEWIDAGPRREAFYTNLPPGTYQFDVRAANPGSEWVETRQPLQLTLLPHFYETPWFIGVSVAAVAGAIWLALRLRVLRLRSRLNAVMAERSRIARELHDTLIQGFSGVTMQMQALVGRLGASEERTTLEGVITDAGTCLREARRTVAGLRNPQGSSLPLSEAIASAARQLTETRDIHLDLKLPESVPVLPVEVEYHLLRIAQEALTNAVNHANAKTIEVIGSVDPRAFVLSIRDNGVGFDVHDHDRIDRGHYGLLGIRERARQIGADCRIDSRPGGGASVRISLPLNGGTIARPIDAPPIEEPIG